MGYMKTIMIMQMVVQMRNKEWEQKAMRQKEVEIKNKEWE